MAAEQGSDTANTLCELGERYCEGRGVPQNYEKGIEWYRIAAEKGSGTAQIKLGDLYFNGLGVPRDCAEAARWYGRVEESSTLYPYQRLGDIYYYGYGVLQDHKEAVKWYSNLAAEMNHILRDSFLQNRRSGIGCFKLGIKVFEL